MEHEIECLPTSHKYHIYEDGTKVCSTCQAIRMAKAGTIHHVRDVPSGVCGICGMTFAHLKDGEKCGYCEKAYQRGAEEERKRIDERVLAAVSLIIFEEDDEDTFASGFDSAAYRAITAVREGGDSL